MSQYQTGRAINSLAREFKRCLRQLLPPEITAQQYQVIHFLYRNQKNDIYQRDLESHLGSARSSISELVRGMEEEGLLVRESVEHDARLKKLSLTTRAITLYNQYRTDLAAMESQMSSGISDYDLNVFWQVADQMRANLTD